MQDDNDRLEVSATRRCASRNTLTSSWPDRKRTNDPSHQLYFERRPLGCDPCESGLTLPNVIFVPFLPVVFKLAALIVRSVIEGLYEPSRSMTRFLQTAPIAIRNSES